MDIKNVLIFPLLKISSLFFKLAITNEGDADAVGIAIVNTILGGCGGGLSALFIEKYRTGKYSYLTTLNGALTGIELNPFPNCIVRPLSV